MDGPLIGCRAWLLGDSARDRNQPSASSSPRRGARSRVGCRRGSRAPARSGDLRVGELPVDVALARDEGQASPQPIVTTTSAHSASARSSLCGTRLGDVDAAVRASRSTTSGWTRSPGSLPAERASWPPLGRQLEQRLRHLRASGVVDADKEDATQAGSSSISWRAASRSCSSISAGLGVSPRTNWYTTAASAAPIGGAIR